MMKHLSQTHRVWFCDIWGVVHNGREVFAATVACLAAHRKSGGTVVLVSNSPRSETGIRKQLDELGVPHESYDAAVTSGDVTRTLIAEIPGGRLFHLGPARDLSIFQGLTVSCVPLAEAEAVVCTGLFDDEHETPDQYDALLLEMKTRNLIMICANPDKQVRKGNRLLWCAGALADRFAAFGGAVKMAGKPFAPIYELARRKAQSVRGATFSDGDILAIGDGPETDIAGAANQGFACLYVTGGVRDHSSDLAAELALIRRLVPTAEIAGAVAELRWNGEVPT